ncbi:MAG: response regulator, partial [Desulfobacteraceae bacterium]|nr:response regulator [Desulfobacteraceae bacterium]
SLLDITKRKVAEHALESSHERFLTILNSIDATIYVADMKTHEIIFVNKLMKEHFGSDMTGEICWQAFRKGTGPCSHCTNAQLVDENNRPKGVRTWQGKNPLNNKWYNNYDRAIEWTDGRIVKLQIATDITYIKNIETELHQAHKMDSIGTLAGGIAHDFNNILFPIMGYTELLMEEIPEKSPLKDTLKEIHNGTMRARDLIKQILTFSRQDISEFKLIKIQPIIEEGLKLIRSSIPATIKIEQNISSDCGIIKADPIQIHQIVMNLSTNAYHAMTDTGGKLTIDLKKVELNSKNIMNPEMKSGDYACLTIKDTGMGMDKNIIEKIFDPFFTTKKAGKGTGMGLSVVHGIVKKMNGAIQFESELSKGTEFNIYLPIEKKSIEESESISPIKTPKQKGNEQILLVDDEEDIVTMEKRMLKNFGYQVTALTSSTEALETFHDDPNKFDIVITDMAMPNMSGEKLSAEIKKIHPDIPILLCTGYSEVMSKEKATSLGIKGFLLKPIVMEDLANKIREILDGNTPKITETKKTQGTDNAYL